MFKSLYKIPFGGYKRKNLSCFRHYVLCVSICSIYLDVGFHNLKNEERKKKPCGLTLSKLSIIYLRYCDFRAEANIKSLKLSTWTQVLFLHFLNKKVDFSSKHFTDLYFSRCGYLNRALFRTKHYNTIWYQYKLIFEVTLRF